MTRQQPALRPPTPATVARVPDLRTDHREAHRAVWAPHGPWWFSTRSDDPDAAGRFDLERPGGTCYFADDPIGALVEKLTHPDDVEPLVTRDELERLVVWSGWLTRPPTIADTTARTSRLPRELGTLTPYDLCWAWADALAEAGRGGLLAWLRLDPAGTRSISVFGLAGVPAPDDEWPPLADHPATSWADALAEAIDVIEERPVTGELLWAPEPE